MRDNAQSDGRPLSGSKPRSYFSPSMDQNSLHRIQCACAGVSVVCNCNAVFRAVDDVLLRARARRHMMTVQFGT